MSKYIDLVVVSTRFGKRIFEAPSWSYLKAGERVKVDTRAGEVDGTVIDSSTVAVDELDFYFNLTEATRPLKRVVARVVESRLNYPEEIEEDVDAEEEIEDGREE